MPFNVFKKLFPNTTLDYLVATKDRTILRMGNRTTIIQLEICSVVIENNNKCTKCIFFVVSGDGDALLGMPDIELLNILQINCNTIGIEKEVKGTN